VKKGKMGKTRISIIIPAYNAAKHIGKCLKAVRNQTFDNFEVIVVDDGSRDKTVSVCEEIAKLDDRIKVIKAEHGGVSKARNTGLENAVGELVTFFDADDYPETNVLYEYDKAFAEWNDSVSLVLCGMYWENRRDRLVPQEKNLLETARGYREGANYLLHNHDVSELAWNKLLNFVTNKCFKMSVIKEDNIHFEEKVQIAEDLQFNLDYMSKAEGFIGVINKPLYHYVKYGGNSLSSSYYGGAIEHVCKSFDKLLDFVKKQPGVSKDDEYVIEAIYLRDWVSRLSMLMEDDSISLSKRDKYKICNMELQKPRFKEILMDSHKGRKIGNVRYFLLKNLGFKWFFTSRKLYHGFKMKDNNGEN